MSNGGFYSLQNKNQKHVLATILSKHGSRATHEVPVCQFMLCLDCFVFTEARQLSSRLSPDLFFYLRRLQRIYTPNYQPFSSWTDRCVGVEEFCLSQSCLLYWDLSGNIQVICPSEISQSAFSTLFPASLFLSSLRETLCMSTFFFSLSLLFPCYFQVLWFKFPCNCYVGCLFVKGPLICQVSYKSC